MRKNAFIAANHIAVLNEFKRHSIKSCDLPLSRTDFCNLFKNCGIPSNSLFFTEFKNSGLLIKVEGNMYTWKNKHPIHHLTLQSIYARYQKKINTYANTRYCKKKREKEIETEEIRKAITLLKDNGFKIFMQCGEFYRVL